MLSVRKSNAKSILNYMTPFETRFPPFDVSFEMATGTSASTHNIIRGERNESMKPGTALRTLWFNYQAVLGPDMPDFLLDRNRSIGRFHLIGRISPSHLQQNLDGS